MSTIRAHFHLKVAEAILSEQTSVAGGEDAGSIRLENSRIGDEQQLLAADDEKDGEERSRSSSLDKEDGRTRGRLGDTLAQMDQLDVHTLNGDSLGRDEPRSDDGLSAKAGVILVSL